MNKTVLYLIIALPVMALFSCKKSKSLDERKKEYILGVMTNGRWFLEYYAENGVDMTDFFKEYEFQFHESGKLDGTKNNTIQTGNWSGDINTLILIVNFSSPDDVLQKLNYRWQWLKANVGLVFAETQTASGTKVSIRLRRK